MSRFRLLTGALGISSLVFAGVSAAGAHAGSGRTPAQASLTDRLNSILSDPRLDGSQYTLTVRDASSGDTLYGVDTRRRMLPASNAKIFTSAAAMDVLGADYRFKTALYTSGHLDGHTLTGSVYLKGYGDPTATMADYDKLAAELERAGVTKVDGALVADDTYWDAERLAPFWSWDDEPYYYDAQTSALNIAPDDIGDTGTVLVNLFPGAHVGDKPIVKMIPANHYLKIHNTATTGAAGSSRTVYAVREHGRNVIDVAGSIALGASNYASQPTVWEPTGLVADVFRRSLAEHGITVGASRYAATPSTAHLVARDYSVPLAQILVPFLKLSNNMIAEALVKAIGVVASGEGSWSAGAAAILDDAASNGVASETLQLFDGSGLGRADYLTGGAITTLLIALQHKPWFDTWYDALPIAGEPDSLVGGTLRNRMGGTPAAGNLHGKTGSMTGVSALSGYVTDRIRRSAGLLDDLEQLRRGRHQLARGRRGRDAREIQRVSRSVADERGVEAAAGGEHLGPTAAAVHVVGQQDRPARSHRVDRHARPGEPGVADGGRTPPVGEDVVAVSVAGPAETAVPAESRRVIAHCVRTNRLVQQRPARQPQRYRSAHIGERGEQAGMSGVSTGRRRVLVVDDAVRHASVDHLGRGDARQPRRWRVVGRRHAEWCEHSMCRKDRQFRTGRRLNDRTQQHEAEIRVRDADAGRALQRLGRAARDEFGERRDVEEQPVRRKTGGVGQQMMHPDSWVDAGDVIGDDVVQVNATVLNEHEDRWQSREHLRQGCDIEDGVHRHRAVAVAPFLRSAEHPFSLDRRPRADGRDEPRPQPVRDAGAQHRVRRLHVHGSGGTRSAIRLLHAAVGERRDGAEAANGLLHRRQLERDPPRVDLRHVRDRGGHDDRMRRVELDLVAVRGVHGHRLGQWVERRCRCCGSMPPIATVAGRSRCTCRRTP